MDIQFRNENGFLRNKRLTLIHGWLLSWDMNLKSMITDWAKKHNSREWKSSTDKSSAFASPCHIISIHQEHALTLMGWRELIQPTLFLKCPFLHEKKVLEPGGLRFPDLLSTFGIKKIALVFHSDSWWSRRWGLIQPPFLQQHPGAPLH